MKLMFRVVTFLHDYHNAHGNIPLQRIEYLYMCVIVNYIEGLWFTLRQLECGNAHELSMLLLFTTMISKRNIHNKRDCVDVVEHPSNICASVPNDVRLTFQWRDLRMAVCVFFRIMSNLQIVMVVRV